MMTLTTDDPRTRCKRCGSTYFQIADFAEYEVIPGGGYHILSERPHQAVVCLCGQAISLMKLFRNDKDDRSFHASMVSAQDYQERTGSQHLMGELENDFITRADFQTLTDQIAALESILQRLAPEK